MQDSTTRFSDRVADYIKYRPQYPKALLELLINQIGLTPQSVVADIGSGTGISSLLFLENGNQVYGVEPNDAMRHAAESMLSEYDAFVSINGTSENTTLDDASVDVVYCAQAFHWFDREKAKKEFSRILRKNGHTVVVWNERDDNDPFTQAYGNAMTVIPELKDQNRKVIPDNEMLAFFTPQPIRKFILKNQQQLDLAGLKGRLLSSSYVPKEGPVFESLMENMNTLFQNHAIDGMVTMVYETRVYLNH